MNSSLVSMIGVNRPYQNHVTKESLRPIVLRVFPQVGVWMPTQWRKTGATSAPVETPPTLRLTVRPPATTTMIVSATDTTAPLPPDKGTVQITLYGHSIEWPYPLYG